MIGVNAATSIVGAVEPWNAWSRFARNTSDTSGFPRRWT
jgi:hypothetical protein